MPYVAIFDEVTGSSVACKDVGAIEAATAIYVAVYNERLLSIKYFSTHGVPFYSLR
jgi:hypothetical protein